MAIAPCMLHRLHFRRYAILRSLHLSAAWDRVSSPLLHVPTVLHECRSSPSRNWRRGAGAEIAALSIPRRTHDMHSDHSDARGELRTTAHALGRRSPPSCDLLNVQGDVFHRWDMRGAVGAARLAGFLEKFEERLDDV